MSPPVEWRWLNRLAWWLHVKGVVRRQCLWCWGYGAACIKRDGPECPANQEPV